MYCITAFCDIDNSLKQVLLGYNEMCWWSEQTAVGIFTPLLFGSFFGLKAIQLGNLHNCAPMWHQTTVCLYVSTQCCLFSAISKHSVVLFIFDFYIFLANSVLYCLQEAVHLLGCDCAVENSDMYTCWQSRISGLSNMCFLCLLAGVF